uniref:ATP synthase subunit C lysine N-methyltransferase n=1 Tax=Equus caballus TaxID=9796 RepID=F6Q384_HORSE
GRLRTAGSAALGAAWGSRSAGVLPSGPFVSGAGGSGRRWPLPWLGDRCSGLRPPRPPPRGAPRCPVCGWWRGAPPETLREEGQLGCVPPPGLEASCVKKSSWGFLFTGIVGGTLVAVYAVATPFITPALRRICLPFVPATTKQIENVVKMLRGRRGSVVDVGSGDGRIVIAAAKEGFAAAGYELNPWLVWYSRYRAWREGVQGSAKFYISDLWKVSFSQYSNVVIFGVPQMMPQLEKKLELELEDNARVIACRFPFPHWTPDQAV